MHTRLIALFFSFALLSACGGGGGSNGGGGGGSGGGGGGPTAIDPATVVFLEQFIPEASTLLSYPTGWTRDIVPGSPEVLAIFIEGAQGANDVFLENVSIVQVAGSNIRDGSGVTDINVVSSRTITIDGVNGQETVFDANVPGESLPLRFMELSYTQDGTVFGLFYVAERADFNRNAEVVRFIAANLRLGVEVLDDFFLGSDLETPGRTPIASDGNNYLVVSCRDSNGFPFSSELVGQLVGPDRRQVGDEILIQSDVDTGGTGCRFTRPSITFDGINYLVTYMTALNGRRDIVARRVSTAGQLIDTDPIDVTLTLEGDMFEPAVVFTGSDHLVVWHRDIPGDINDEVWGAFVGVDSSVTPAFNIFDGMRTLYPDQFGNFISRPEVAMGQNEAMVIVSPRFERDVRQPDRPIYAQLIDMSGNRLLADPLLVREDNGDNPRYPQVATDGQSYLVTWIEGLLEESTISSGLSGIYGREISSSGQLINGDASSTGLEIVASDSDRPKEDLQLIAANNQFYLLWSVTSFGTDYGIYGNTVSSDLSAVTPVQPIGGTRDLTQNLSMPRISNPYLGFSSTSSIVVWPVRDGVVEAWLLPDGF